MENEPAKSCSPCGSWWRLPLLLGLVLAVMLLSRGRSLWETKPNPRAAPNSAGGPAFESVSLAIDFGNGQHKDLPSIAWREGLTVADLFNAAPGVFIKQKGSGQGALLTAIDDVANEGADGKNWTYDVNFKDADRSFAVYELHPGDRVLWTFGSRR
jgi:hypothetical protein